jgi:hypothetical protein
MIDSHTPAAKKNAAAELFGWFMLCGVLGLAIALIGAYLLRVPAPMIFVLLPSLLLAGDVPGGPEGIGAWALEILFMFGPTFVLYGLAGVATGSLLNLRRTSIERRAK